MVVVCRLVGTGCDALRDRDGCISFGVITEPVTVISQQSRPMVLILWAEAVSCELVFFLIPKKTVGLWQD
jgi:hypothetical protein